MKRGLCQRNSWSWPGGRTIRSSWLSDIRCSPTPHGGRAISLTCVTIADSPWRYTTRSSTAPVLCPTTRTTASFPDISPRSTIGCWDTRLRRSRRWRTRSRTPVSSSNPNSVGISLLFLAQLSQLRREPEPATTRAEEALAVAAEHGLPALELWCLLPRGWAIAQQGDVPRASPTSVRRWTADGRSAWARCGLGIWRCWPKRTARSDRSTRG